MAHFAKPQSFNSAVRIVNPAEQSDDPKPLPKRESPQRQCRNVLIYGSCRFQDKGCIYYHPPPDSPTNPAHPDSPALATLTAQAVNAPVFVPKTSFNPVSATSPTPPHSLSPSSSPSPYYSSHDEYDLYTQNHATNGYSQSPDELDVANEYQQVEHPLTYLSDHMSQADFDDTATSLGSFYQPTQPPYVQQPLDYHLYTRPIPETFVPSHFMSDSVREELQRRSEAAHSITFPSYNLPEELQGYHSLVPLEQTQSDRRKFFSWFSTVYRATNAHDGQPYTLRRVENFRLIHQVAFDAIEAWSRVQHPNIVRLWWYRMIIIPTRKHYSTCTCAPSSLCFHRVGLEERQMLPFPKPPFGHTSFNLRVRYKRFTKRGWRLGMVDPTKILLTGKNRLRISSCGMVDVLMYDTRQDVALLQQEDLVMFGRLVFALCCGNLAAMNTLPKALDMMGRMYSADVKTLALYLISKPGPHKGIAQVIEMIGKNRLLREMDEVQIGTDRLESELASELENGRLVRLLCKLGFINERPEFAREPRWSETGDRYIIKLFRDYVFHQVDENGNPVVNLSHVLACLNKLDSGTDERIMVVSRDEQSCLVVSYKEVKSCIDAAFRASR
ncbi:hypothetical protein J3R82DRAFT_8895 [Butyriboletus roseoflavus]|nr:hypothetical protein J3R82DRAFT_8895 [Butyriboletus roseoflavus]